MRVLGTLVADMGMPIDSERWFGASWYLPALAVYAGFAVVYVLVARLIVTKNAFYGRVTAREAGKRCEMLDGLRGFLALGVFLHHAQVTQHWLRCGEWGALGSFNLHLGRDAVALFFMITGFLFWGKAIRGKVQALPLYLNRLRRIAPLYLVSICAVIVIALWSSRFALNTSPFAFAKHVVRVSALGMFPWDQVTRPGQWVINAGVAWTLVYEWRFYLLLPLLAPLATPRRFVLLTGAVVASVWIGDLTQNYYYFLCGMLAAHVLATDMGRRIFRSPILVGIGLIVLAALGAGHGAAEPAQLPVLTLFLIAAACGCPLLGGLNWLGCRYLGTVSYSVYLLHGIVLYVVTHALNRVVPVGSMPAVEYLGVIFVCGLITILLSGVTYRYIEYPFLAGKHREEATARQTARMQDEGRDFVLPISRPQRLEPLPARDEAAEVSPPPL